MFGGGFLGVGPAEVFVIVAVGWLVLGPQRLFAVARDAGKVLGQVRKTADDAKNSFSDALGAESLGIGDLSDPLGLGTSVAATKARKVQEKEAEQEREREREAAAAAGVAPEGGKPVAGAADALAAAVSAEPAGPAPAPVTAAAKATEQPVGATADKSVTATTGAAKPGAAKPGAAKPGPTAPAAPTTANGAVPEALVRTPDDRPGEEAMAQFKDQLRRVNDPNQKAELDDPAMLAALAADPLPPLAGDVPPELAMPTPAPADVPTDVALAELEAAYAAAKKKLLLKGLAEMEGKTDGESGHKSV